MTEVPKFETYVTKMYLDVPISACESLGLAKNAYEKRFQFVTVRGLERWDRGSIHYRMSVTILFAVRAHHLRARAWHCGKRSETEYGTAYSTVGSA